MIKLDKNIPPPEGRGRWAQVFDDMEIGDSFAVPYFKHPTTVRGKVLNSLYYWKENNKVSIFKLISDVRVEDGNKVVRFWRVK